jgi:arylsulfatase A-like enzyme
MRKLILSNIVLIFIIVSCITKKRDRNEIQEKPNIVLIISDDHGWTDYSFMGHAAIKTPNIDRLAIEGMTFTHGYTPAPLSSPALASIFTGLYPHQHGILGNDPVFSSAEKAYSAAWMKQRMGHYQPLISGFEKIETIADVLGKNGYASLQTGKWWIGNYKSGGFDEGMTHGDPSKGGRHGDIGLKIGRNGMDELYNFIDSTSTENQPFFVWYAPMLPHSPHNPPDSLLQKYLAVAPTKAVASYWAMCEWFDITCGQLINHIEKKGLGRNTVFVYVTDNGWIQHPDKPNIYAPRSKREPYEMGIRTPIIFRWEGKILPDMNTTTAVSSLDIAPTIYKICGIASPGNLQGINLLDKEATEKRDVFFAETFDHDFSSIDSSLQNIVALDYPLKLILRYEDGFPVDSVELYNLENDPHELQNIAGKEPEKVAEIREKTINWWNNERNN